MSNKTLKKIMILLILLTTRSIYGQATSQIYSKLGDNPFNLNSSAALEVESTGRGFLPPRMNMEQRDKIPTPAAGLIVYCTDCNKSTTPATGQFCLYAEERWTSILFSTTMTSSLTTGKKDDAANAPVMINNHSVQINGLLANTFGASPSETGILYREISNNADYPNLPFLDTSGNAVAPVYKAESSPTVTTSGSAISVSVDLTSATGNTRPYYFRTYAKNASSIGYGNVVIFNVAPPLFSPVTVTDGNTSAPKFATTLTINAGTPPKITEYGYCSSTTKTSPIIDDNKVIISTVGDITALNASLNKDAFTVDPTAINLLVTDYEVKIPDLTYFRYYVIINGIPYYSNATSFTPLGLAIIDGLDSISNTLTTGVASSSFFRIRFNPAKTGSYSFAAKTPTGATKGLSIASMSGDFVAGTPKVIDFLLNGTPYGSLDGNSFEVLGVGTLVTKKIAADPITAGSSVVSFLDATLSEQLKYGKVSSSVFNVRFNVIKSGNYNFTIANPTGATEGLSMLPSVNGTFSDNDMGKIKTLVFAVNGTPSTSFDGNSFVVSGIKIPLSTGAILDRDPNVNAICNGTVPTKVTGVFSKTGAIWMDRNLGASRVAVSSDDIKAYGCLYQWGRGNDGHASINWTSNAATAIIVNGTTPALAATPVPGNAFIKTGTATDWLSSQNDMLWQGLNGINNPCPADYRLPTITELNLEFTTYKVMNAADAYNKSVLKIPSSGYIVFSGVFNGLADRFFLWSSTVSLTNPGTVISYNGYNNSTDNPNLTRSFGFSVRCIKDNSSDFIDTGGTSEATVSSVGNISSSLTTGVRSGSSIKVSFNVTKGGSYSFTPADPTGATKGLSIAPVTGNFTDTPAVQTVDFPVNGIPYDSLEGNSFVTAGKTLVTGKILPDPITGGSAVATFIDATISQQLKIGEASTSKIIARFSVTKTGSYDSFTPTAPAGATTGLTLSPAPANRFAATDIQTVQFTVNGTPNGSIDGNSFEISNALLLKTGTFSTGKIAYTSAVFTFNRAETISSPTTPLRIGNVADGSNYIRVYLDVSRAGIYDSFVVTSTIGQTKGLGLATVPAGTFAAAKQYIDFPVIGTPETSLDGNSFYVSGIAPPLNTGVIKPFQAICDGSTPTAVVDITSVANKKWMDRNLGASRTATSMNDYQAYGCLYQWGRSNDGAANINWTSSTSRTIANGMTAVNARFNGDSPGIKFIPISINPGNWRSPGNTDLWQGVGGKNNPCPAGYRIPTAQELKVEVASVTNAETAYTSSLKLVFSKNVNDFGSFTDSSIYWSSTTVDSNSSYNLLFSDNVFFPNNYSYNVNGGSVRCIKN